MISTKKPAARLLMYLILGATIQYCATSARAQILIDSGNTQSSNQDSGSYLDTHAARSVPVGKAAARQFFVVREEHERGRYGDERINRGPDSVSSDNHYLMLSLGTFLNDKAYQWGSSHQDNVGSGMLGVTYRIRDLSSSMDLWFRAELQSYNVSGDHPQQLIMMPVIAFPDAASDFPMYFGGGVGPGVFLRQVNGSGDLALDYVVLMGVRFTNLFNSGGLFMESGIKGLVNLLSEGQQEGVYLSAGGVFVF